MSDQHDTFLAAYRPSALVFLIEAKHNELFVINRGHPH